MRRIVWISLVAAALTSSLADAATGGSWSHAAPEAQGADSSKLEAMRRTIDALGLSIDAVVVVRHGAIVFEHSPSPAVYRPNTLRNLCSVTKSVTSILIGIAIEQGFIGSLDQSVVGFFPDREIANLDARKECMTLEHLLIR